MPKQAAIVLRLKESAPHPEGFELVRTLRGVKIYHKKVDEKPKQSELDDLITALEGMGISKTQQVAVTGTDDLATLLGGLSLAGGKSRKSSGKSRKSRKQKRKTHRRRYH